MKQLAALTVLALLVGSVLGDIYMHYPPGSNDRCNENTAERTNGDRLFDSQNNNRGGYNVGEKSTTAAAGTGTTTLGAMVDPTDQTTQIQYSLVWYEGSVLPIEWTSQHGCGGNEEDDSAGRNCNQVLQFMCDGNGFNVDTQAAETDDQGMAVTMRDGTDEGTVNTDGNDADNGIHESPTWYRECQRRQRNQGLYLADNRDANGNNNDLNGNTAQFTRQNPDGTRRGLECPEERDYYPYFIATPWRDIAYLTDRVDLCPLIQTKSQNNNVRTRCYGGTNPNGNTLDATNENDCANRGGTFKRYTWDLPAPTCRLGDWGRENHLGNSRNNQPLQFNWTIPTVASLKGATIYTDGTTTAQYAKCIVRARYNISTDDYDPWYINSTYNTNANQGQTVNGIQLITTNPTVDIGADLQGLKLAINTNQFGRTFQDRSHVFYIRTRPANIPANAKVYNLGVRGKRGNIVQTFPAVEYDFQPNRLHIDSGDFIHIQWTGSNTHNNQAPGGDGQTGDDPQNQGHTAGTDRNNFVLMNNQADTYPIPLDTFPDNMFSRARCYQLSGTTIGINNHSPNPQAVNVDCALWLATSGYYRTEGDVVGQAGGDDPMSPVLNNVSPSLIGGVVLHIDLPNGVNTPQHYHYMCTRNNNFSNRSQKGSIIVTP